jgi:peptidoglycan hydrolase CwlO-like protein
MEQQITEVKKENTRLDRELGRLINTVQQQELKIAKLEREIARLKANIDSIVSHIRKNG